MPSNAQPIPSGISGIKSFVDFFVGNKYSGAPMEDEDTTYQNSGLTTAPSVYIDGILLTYEVRSDRRYISFDENTNTITINNGYVNSGENVQIIK